MLVTQLVTLTALICLFLFAVFKLSKQLSVQLHSRLHHSLSHKQTTSSPWLSALIGTIATVFVQSSSVITVLTVTLVEARLITLLTGIAIVIGSNVGTTISANIATFDLSLVAPIILLIGFLAQFASGGLKKWSKSLFYLGLLLLVMVQIAAVSKLLSSDPLVASALSTFTNPYLALLVGILVTSVVQSSTAVTVLTVLLVTQGLIQAPQAIGIILGANIGTTMTAVLAAIPLHKQAQQIALAHVLFNVLGTLIALPFLSSAGTWLPWFGSQPASQIALVNTLFNAVTAVLALLLIKPFYKLVLRLSTLLPSRHTESIKM